MSEQYRRSTGPFLPASAPWVNARKLDDDCRKACTCFFAILQDAAALDPTALNPNTQSILILLDYYRIPLQDYYQRITDYSQQFKVAYDRFTQELQAFTGNAGGFRINRDDPLIPNSTATELLLRLLLDMAPRLQNGNPSITTIGKPHIESKHLMVFHSDQHRPTDRSLEHQVP
jgi:hypothetical protein